ncbi:hypothetical protein BDV93DRAFT_516184 [Ceratobasidium sp. AG-I]|nr:hypothetical protein BDV93DRAFT_516184 [Ceratobasidium sp. AG-I]
MPCSLSPEFDSEIAYQTDPGRLSTTSYAGKSLMPHDFPPKPEPPHTTRVPPNPRQEPAKLIPALFPLIHNTSPLQHRFRSRLQLPPEYTPLLQMRKTKTSAPPPACSIPSWRIVQEQLPDRVGQVYKPDGVRWARDWNATCTARTMRRICGCPVRNFMPSAPL